MVKTSNNEEKHKGENNKTKVIIKSLYKKKIKDKKIKMNSVYTTEYLLHTSDFVYYAFTCLSPLLG